MHTSRIRRIQLVIMAAAMVAVMLPSFVGSFAAQAQAKKTLNWQAAGEPATIDPQQASFTDGVAYSYALWRSLLRYDHNNQPSPSIAKDVPTVANGGVSADGKTYTYHLRTDWKWSDGNGVVKAQDFVYAFQRLVDPHTASGYGSFLDGLLLNADNINNGVAGFKLSDLGVKAVDDFTVQFTLVHPASYWNQIACLWFGAAVRKDNVERAGDPATGAWTDPSNGAVVGSGPFILTKWDHNKEMVFTKNTNWAGGSIALDEIDLPIIQDPAISYAGFKAGQLDVAAFPAAEYHNIKADPVLGVDWKPGAIGLLTYPLACTFYLGMDNTKAPFNNIDARYAFSYAFDRDSYVHVIANDLAQKWLSFLPKDIAGADPNLGKDFDYNPDKAKAELAKAGYPNGAGFPAISYHYPAGATGQRRADWLQAQFKKVLNVTITEDPMDSAAYEAAQSDAKNKLDGMYTLGWCADYLHPSDWLIPVFGGLTADPNGNATNVSGYNDPEFDKTASQADNTVDPTAALALYQKAQGILVKDQPVIFFEVTVNTFLISAKVKNLPAVSLDGGEPGAFYWEEIDVNS